ncbi:MATE family efflux transporter [Faecalispora anaeroviscerum]|uniref:MATE family efflux transporter n=1 Tax=Faecalispora anaeroviscerum TaxID=2991836 RepID=UPI0024BA0CC7|nr:MATE family efflux transporter [Faecalispora anaeroviscerum]
MDAQNASLKVINKQFIKYVIPSVIGMVVQALYIVLDGIIVGQGIGEIALAAINIVFPFGMIVIALAMLIAVGGANVYSFYKGQGELVKANNIFCQCLAIAFVIGFVMTLPGFFFREQLVLLAGANEALLLSAMAYLKWMAPFFLFQMIVCLLSVFVRNDNAPRLVMVATVTGAIVNTILDVILILILHYGIEAAAITNGVGMLLELTFYATYFWSKKGMLRIRKPVFHFVDIKRIVSNGFATFLMELSLPAVTFSFNLAIIYHVGTLGVTAYSIVGYVCAIINMVLIGVTQGAQPLMSLYHGQGNKKAFTHIYHLGVRTNIVIPVLLVSVCFIFSDGIVSLFHAGNPELTALTSHMLRLYPLAHIAIGVTLMNILFFQATEQNTFSTAISFLRCIGFIQIFLILSIELFSGKGLYFAFFFGELCHMIISQILVQRAKRLEITAAQTETGINQEIIESET